MGCSLVEYFSTLIDPQIECESCINSAIINLGFSDKITSTSQSNLVGQIQQTFASLSDALSGNGIYQKHNMSDTALSAFSVFFMSSPTFLNFQKMIKKEHGKNNTDNLFDVYFISSTNQIRNFNFQRGALRVIAIKVHLLPEKD